MSRWQTIVCLKAHRILSHKFDRPGLWSDSMVQMNCGPMRLKTFLVLVACDQRSRGDYSIIGCWVRFHSSESPSSLECWNLVFTARSVHVVLSHSEYYKVLCHCCVRVFRGQKHQFSLDCGIKFAAYQPRLYDDLSGSTHITGKAHNQALAVGFCFVRV